jgi:hypothetical protein
MKPSELRSPSLRCRLGREVGGLKLSLPHLMDCLLGKF